MRRQAPAALRSKADDGASPCRPIAGGAFASLGMRPGEYVWSWGSGAHADAFTVDVGGIFASPVPEPSTWAMMLVGFGGLGYAARVIKRREITRLFPATTRGVPPM